MRSTRGITVLFAGLLTGLGQTETSAQELTASDFGEIIGAFVEQNAPNHPLVFVDVGSFVEVSEGLPGELPADSIAQQLIPPFRAGTHDELVQCPAMGRDTTETITSGPYCQVRDDGVVLKAKAFRGTPHGASVDIFHFLNADMNVPQVGFALVRYEFRRTANGWSFHTASVIASS